MSRLTTSRPRQLRQPQTRIVRWRWFKRNITMPLRRTLVLRTLPALIDELLLVKLVELHRAYRGDLGIRASELAVGVQHGMDVKTRVYGLAGELAQALDQGFLDVVG